MLVFLRKTPEFTKIGEIHELFVLALSLVWFAGATPENWQYALIETTPFPRFDSAPPGLILLHDDRQSTSSLSLSKAFAEHAQVKTWPHTSYW